MMNENLLRSSKCLGANILLKLLNNYTRTSNEIKQSITVGIIGMCEGLVFSLLKKKDYRLGLNVF